VYGRLSAERFIHLEAGCAFEHMHAAKIHTIEQEDSDGRSPVTCSCCFPQSKCHICEIESNHPPDCDDVNDIFASHRRRIRHHGDFALSAHQTLNANVVSTGSVRFGPHSRFMGNTKSYKDTFVDEGACIHGSLVCGATLHLGERSSVTGPLMAEQDVVIASGARVGRPDALTTIAARNIRIAVGCQLHGTVWARVRGTVEN
jgi:cytoskeletal protein CcmA (bactofilin family)